MGQRPGTVKHVGKGNVMQCYGRCKAPSKIQVFIRASRDKFCLFHFLPLTDIGKKVLFSG